MKRTTSAVAKAASTHQAKTVVVAEDSMEFEVSENEAQPTRHCRGGQKQEVREAYLMQLQKMADWPWRTDHEALDGAALKQRFYRLARLGGKCIGCARQVGHLRRKR